MQDIHSERAQLSEKLKILAEAVNDKLLELDKQNSIPLQENILPYATLLTNIQRTLRLLASTDQSAEKLVRLKAVIARLESQFHNLFGKPALNDPVPMVGDTMMDDEELEAEYQKLLSQSEESSDDFRGVEPSLIAELDELTKTNDPFVAPLATKNTPKPVSLQSVPNPIPSPAPTFFVDPKKVSAPPLQTQSTSSAIPAPKMKEDVDNDEKENKPNAPNFKGNSPASDKSTSHHSSAEKLGSCGSFPKPKKKFCQALIKHLEKNTSFKHCEPTILGEKSIVFRDSTLPDNHDPKYNVVFTGNERAFEIKSQHLDSMTKLTQAIVTKSTTITINSNRKSDVDYASMRLDLITLMRLTSSKEGIKVKTENLDYLRLLSNDPGSMDLLLNTLSKNPSDERLHQFLSELKTAGQTVIDVINNYFEAQATLKEDTPFSAKARK